MRFAVSIHFLYTCALFTCEQSSCHVHMCGRVHIKCGSQGRDCSCKYRGSASAWQPWPGSWWACKCPTLMISRPDDSRRRRWPHDLWSRLPGKDKDKGKCPHTESTVMIPRGPDDWMRSDHDLSCRWPDQVTRLHQMEIWAVISQTASTKYKI